jgi:MbtH protein
MAYEQEDNRVYIVLINEEGQYSLWLQGKKIPSGWRFADKEGSKSECMSYVDANWTDMRPLSLRRKMGDAIGRSL